MSRAGTVTRDVLTHGTGRAVHPTFVTAPVHAVPMCMIVELNTHQQRLGIRANFVSDEKRLSAALRLTGAPVKGRVAEDSLRLVIQLKRQDRVRAARGTLKWRGGLEAHAWEPEISGPGRHVCLGRRLERPDVAPS
jgi:hypothetical protein